MNKKNTLFIFAIFASVFLLVSINKLQKNINNIIVQEELTDLNPIVNAPPMIAFTTVVLGAFRGILADVLWYRSTEMYDEGRYFEMVQLASWITKLQPRFSGGAVFLAWNMSYNITASMSTDKDRWRWVQKGIELLRDEAIPYNPTDQELYRQLAWIYMHKVGDMLDESHLYYKYQIAKEFIGYIGYEPNWNNLYISPKTLKELDKKYNISSKLKIENLEKLRDYYFLNKKLPNEINNAFSQTEQNQILNSFKVIWLAEKLKLEIDYIKLIHEKYGVLDWALPETHAIYWAYLGLKKGRRNSNVDINLQRIINGSLKDSFFSGKILLANTPKDSVFLPNLNLLDVVRNEYLSGDEEYQVDTFKGALRAFDKSALILFYNYGKYSKAQELFKGLAERHPDDPEFKMPLELYAFKMWESEIGQTDQKKMSSMLTGLLYQACYYYANGINETAVAHFRIAKMLHKNYQKKKKRILSRVGLAPFDKMKRDVAESCMKSFPKLLAANLKRALENE